MVTLALLVPRVATAQSGSCPDWTTPHGSTPAGVYPSNMGFCDDGRGGTEVIHQPDAPCGGGMKVGRDLFDDPYVLTIVPPLGWNYPSGVAEFHFYIAGYAFGDRPITQNIQVVITSYSSTGEQLGNYVMDTTTKTGFQTEAGFFWKVPSGSFEKALVPAQTNGYFTIEQFGIPLLLADWRIYSLRIVDSLGYSPPLCDIPNLPTPTPSSTPTVTPTPANTSTPTNTPTGTFVAPPTNTPANTPTNQPTPTDTATPPVNGTSPSSGTITPLPTATSYTLNTQEPPQVPTLVGTPQLQALSFPTISFGGGLVPLNTPSSFNVAIEPDATGQAYGTAISGYGATVEAEVAEWQTIGDEIAVYLAVDGVAVTTTAGVSTVTDIAYLMADSVTTPIAVAKSLQFYMPNLWSLILFIILGAVWVVFVVTLKMALAIFGDGADILYKFIKLIRG